MDDQYPPFDGRDASGAELRIEAVGQVVTDGPVRHGPILPSHADGAADQVHIRHVCGVPVDSIARLIRLAPGTTLRARPPRAVAEQSGSVATGCRRRPRPSSTARR